MTLENSKAIKALKIFKTQKYSQRLWQQLWDCKKLIQRLNHCQFLFDLKASIKTSKISMASLDLRGLN